jgi:membrane complex biogenesis BtpA family protein
VVGHVADEGYIASNAAELLRCRKHISANDIAVFTDIKKKHSSHAVTDDLDIAEMAHAAEFFLADGVIVTGMHTGDTADSSEINKVKSATKLPVIVGSGINYENISEYLPLADAFIVGSYFKKDGYWENDLDAQRINEFMKKVNSLR